MYCYFCDSWPNFNEWVFPLFHAPGHTLHSLKQFWSHPVCFLSQGWADIIHRQQARISGDSVIMKGAIVMPVLALYSANTHKSKLVTISYPVWWDNQCHG